MRKVLIANRGEIAVRVTRTLQQMGIGVVTVYADPDQGALHTRVGDEAYRLPGVKAAETYLNQDLLLEVARSSGAEGVHPGYGFLSENAAFARRCREAGLTFIGPTAEVIEAMGDKVKAKAAMQAAGVPIVPSWSPESGATREDFHRQAERLGYPVLLKAAAGGGGKGMRLVRSPADLDESMAQARGEAGKAFGDDRVFLERYLDCPRHVEIQIFGDSLGQVVHLGERECSIQRRYQKIIEESPSPAMTPELREKMGAAACRAARALGYQNAGTVEFLLDGQGQFYFLEVNTRLQVEHPVTEMITGQDLVRAQVLVAQGKPLPFRQEELTPRGWALECRLYAEDPARGFAPSTGTVAVYVAPEGVRVDSGVSVGSKVTPHYDPMLAKIIAAGSSREEALERMDWALSRFMVLGVSHNLEFLRAILSHPEFRAGRTHTHFLSTHPPALQAEGEPPALALLAAHHYLRSGRPSSQVTPRGHELRDPWSAGGGWRL